MPRKKNHSQIAFTQAKNVRTKMLDSLSACASYSSFEKLLETHVSNKAVGSAYTIQGVNQEQRNIIDELDQRINAQIPATQAALAKQAREAIINSLNQCNSYADFQKILDQHEEYKRYPFHGDTGTVCALLDQQINELMPVKRAALVVQARDAILNSLNQCNSYADFQKILDQHEEYKRYPFHGDMSTHCALLDQQINELMPVKRAALVKQAREAIIHSLQQCNSYADFQKILDQHEEYKRYSFHSGVEEDQPLLDSLDQELLQLIEAKKKVLVPLVHVYTDFDGTVTSAPGRKAVFSPFYQSLLINYQEGVRQNYKDTPMKDPEVLQSLFEAKFGKYDEHFNQNQADINLLMAPAAVTFFHQALNSSNVKVSIVTKNRSEYINAMFRYQGFSEGEITQLNIMDSVGKYNNVKHHLDLSTEKPNILLILDDDENDFKQMVAAAASSGYKKENQVIKERKDPGAYDWKVYQTLFPIQNKVPTPEQLDTKGSGAEGTTAEDTTECEQPFSGANNNFRLEPMSKNQLEADSSSMSNISMMVLGGFIAATGLAAVAIAFTLLNAATFGIPGLVVAGVGVAAVLAGVGLFATGSVRQINSENSLELSDNPLLVNPA